MRILIDTHILIWHLEDDSHLSTSRSEIIADPVNEILINIASIWEIAIKLSRNKLELSRSIEDILHEIDSSTSRLAAVDAAFLVKVSQLPFLHRDPFDRLLIAHALVENIPIMTNDSNFASYGVELL